MREADLRLVGELVPEKKYIEVQYDERSQKRLREFCDLHGFDLSVRFDQTRQDPEDFDFHSTVWFTTTEHRMDNKTVTVQVEAVPMNFTLFGENQNILVMEISSPDLHEIRDGFREEYPDINDQFPDYRPHITVCYNYQGTLPEIDLAEEFLEPLIADRLNIKTQKT